MDKLQEWRISQKYKNQPLPFNQQRTLDFLKKSLFKEKSNKPISEEFKYSSAQNKNNLTRGV